MVVVGRIARAHGIRGQVIVDPDTDFPEERFQPGADLYIERGGKAEPLRITAVRFHRQRPILGVDGVATMNDAELLAGTSSGCRAIGWRRCRPATFYRHDLIGCAVFTAGGDRVGDVSGVEGTMTGSRLVVDGPRGEILIPMAAEICTAIDVAAKRIVIDAPEGLLDLNAR
jgi:16S rRNA processing protein RimM